MNVLHSIIAGLTVLTGIAAIIWPNMMSRFTGLNMAHPRGLVEMRAGIGALFIGMGAAPWILGHPIAYQMLGIAYICIAVARFPAMIIHHSYEKSNWISLVIEVVFGVALLFPLYPGL